jgi:hypothetical protein
MSYINDTETPKNIKIKQTDEQMIIINKWFSWKTCEVLKKAIVGLFMILIPFIYVIYFFVETIQTEPWNVILNNMYNTFQEALNLFLENFWINLFRVPLFILISILLLVVIISSIYKALTMLFNKTYIIIDNEAITISHKPFPYPSAGINQTLRINKINYLYCRKNYDERFEEEYARDINEEELAHEIHAVSLNGKDKKLVELNNYYQADYVKRLLQNFYDIKND